MARFLIEVPHDESEFKCALAVREFLRSGSHFCTHADWGCKDGEHKAWMAVEVDSRSDALAIVPPGFRHVARIIQLNTFTLDEIEGIIGQHRS